MAEFVPKVGKIITVKRNNIALPAIIVAVNEDETVNLQVFEDKNGVEYINSYQIGGTENGL